MILPFDSPAKWKADVEYEEKVLPPRTTEGVRV